MTDQQIDGLTDRPTNTRKGVACLRLKMNNIYVICEIKFHTAMHLMFLCISNKTQNNHDSIALLLTITFSFTGVK